MIFFKEIFLNYCAPSSGYTNLRFTQHDLGSGHNPIDTENHTSGAQLEPEKIF